MFVNNLVTCPSFGIINCKSTFQAKGNKFEKLSAKEKRTLLARILEEEFVNPIQVSRSLILIRSSNKTIAFLQSQIWDLNWIMGLPLWLPIQVVWQVYQHVSAGRPQCSEHLLCMVNHRWYPALVCLCNLASNIISNDLVPKDSIFAFKSLFLQRIPKSETSPPDWVFTHSIGCHKGLTFEVIDCFTLLLVRCCLPTPLNEGLFLNHVQHCLA